MERRAASGINVKKYRTIYRREEKSWTQVMALCESPLQAHIKKTFLFLINHLCVVQTLSIV